MDAPASPRRRLARGTDGKGYPTLAKSLPQPQPVTASATSDNRPRAVAPSPMVRMLASCGGLGLAMLAYRHHEGAIVVHEQGDVGRAESTTPTASTADAMRALLAAAQPVSVAQPTDTIAAAAAHRAPMLWPRGSSSPARTWKALSRWSDDARLDALVPWCIARLDERREGEFVLSQPQRGGGVPLLQAAPHWEPLTPPMRNVSISTILRGSTTSQRQQPQQARFYYSGSLHEATTAHWATGALVEDLSPLSPLQIHDVPPLAPSDRMQPPADGLAGPPPQNRTSLRLWLTSPGVFARTHYDKSHNVLCVLRGRKELVLWPPEELPSLHIYPAIHAAHRQSQLSPSRFQSVRDTLSEGRTAEAAGVVGDYPLLDAAALLGGRGAQSAKLGAGDCLYTPPYWAHAVFSPEASVALAAFSTSWEQARWARSGWLMAPIGRFAKGGICSKARGAALLITAFLHACSPLLDGSPRAFLATVYASRYAPIYGALHSPAPGGEALADCLAATDRGDETLPPHAPERDASLRQRVRGFAASIADLLIEADHTAGWRRFSAGVAAELAADYVEELAGWACGADGAWRLLRLLATTEETDLGHAQPRAT